MAVGGFSSNQCLKRCEKYEAKANKWNPLPPLNNARQSPGSVAIQSVKVFCFCGIVGLGGLNSSVETIQLDQAWKTLPVKIPYGRANKLGGGVMGGKIIVFGGEDYLSYMTLVFTEEGELD